MRESVDQLSALRRKIASIERQRPAGTSVLASVGHDGMDRHLGGGLAQGRLHEVYAGNVEDASSATAFVAMLALKLSDAKGAILWLRQENVEGWGGQLYAPGLAEIGMDPGRVILCVMPDALALLRAAAEVVRCPEVGVAIIELWRRPLELDLTASRRLAMAAETSGVPALMLRVEAEPIASAAQTRWQVRSAPSVPLEGDTPGHIALDIELLRQRGGMAGARWQVEWDREQQCFHEQMFADDASFFFEVSEEQMRLSV